ncbi:hypothetical protein [Pedobacter aquatilis]|uniref:hypothetical protein n=1 Tax=Pedobacter aquatilis TaxID=351343 RepID=UPI00292ECB6A|nr:hypothetical protein [Pedobacter aquatilis]
MSIYFQYPAINEYPNLVYPLKKEEIETLNLKDEDSVKRQETEELKDFLTLKPV